MQSAPADHRSLARELALARLCAGSAPSSLQLLDVQTIPSGLLLLLLRRCSSLHTLAFCRIVLEARDGVAEVVAGGWVVPWVAVSGVGGQRT